MNATVRFAETAADQEAIYRLRYEIYVEEMGYKFAGTDHQSRRLVEPIDRPVHRLIAEDDGEIVGTAQCHWGGDATFTDEERRIYRLDDFAPIVGTDGIAILSRFMTRPNYRRGELPAILLDGIFAFAIARGARLVFADCRPHLINSYLRLGFRAYAKTYNGSIAGILAPIVFVLDDIAHLQRIRSRILPLLEDWQPRPDVLSRVLALVPQGASVRLLSDPAGADDWSELQSTLADDSAGQVSIFQGLEPQEIARLVEMSPIITCAPGDRIVGQHVGDRTVFVVLDGSVEVLRGGKLVALMTRGSVFGEIAFLLGIDRTADVVAAEETRVICLREKALNELIASESKLAARFLLNLARIVCLKLAGDREGDAPIG